MYHLAYLMALTASMMIAPSWAFLPQTRDSLDQAFHSPASHGGSQLDSSAGLGEPLNVNDRFGFESQFEFT